MKEEFLNYTDELAGLDDLDNDNCLTPTSTSTLSSPLLFSPSQPNSILNSPDKNIFFNTSNETKSQKLQNDAFDSLFSSSTSQSTTSHTFTNGNTYSMSLNETPKPYTLSHCESPKAYTPSQHGSPNSGTSSDSQNISSPQETPITLLTSPNSRKRRNSSFDETKPHVCQQCGSRFTTKSNLGQHAKIHLKVKPFVCEICSHGFTRAAHYESHVAKHKGLKTHRCDQCGESFARLDNLLRHSARHKHGKIFECATCKRGFHRKDKLLDHEKKHCEYNIPCQKCSKTFHTNDALKHHLPLHEDTTKTQCKICLKFITIKSMSKHMSAFHKEAVNNVNESNNNNPINNNKLAKSRSRTNNNPSNEKMHGCQYCKKSFVSPAKLRLHTAKYHAEERLNEAPPQIDTNGLSFNQTLTDTASTNNESRMRFFEENIQPRYPSPASDGLPSQQVPEMELSYMNSSPEDISDFGNSKDLPGITSNNYPIPTIHIPEFDNLQSRMGDNSEISTEAIAALFLS
jgi:KRAB domain-containing zinc finger protein